MSDQRAAEDDLDDLTRCRDQLRSLAFELSQAQDSERTRIAFGLHDDIGQTLAAAQLRLAELEQSNPSDDKLNLIQNVSDLLAEATEALRTLTFSLMAPLLHGVAIEAEIERLATRIADLHGVTCRFESDARPKPVSPAVATTLLRVTHELLRNVERHSGTREAQVVVARVDDQVRVTVSDDGKGFEPSPPSAPERLGLGLLIVQERLAQVGGSIGIESTPGSGTTAVVTAPLELVAGSA